MPDDWDLLEAASFEDDEGFDEPEEEYEDPRRSFADSVAMPLGSER